MIVFFECLYFCGLFSICGNVFTFVHFSNQFALLEEYSPNEDKFNKKCVDFSLWLGTLGLDYVSTHLCWISLGRMEIKN